MTVDELAKRSKKRMATRKNSPSQAGLRQGGRGRGAPEGGKVFSDTNGGKVFVTDGGKVFDNRA